MAICKATFLTLGDKRMNFFDANLFRGTAQEVNGCFFLWSKTDRGYYGRYGANANGKQVAPEEMV